MPGVPVPQILIPLRGRVGAGAPLNPIQLIPLSLTRVKVDKKTWSTDWISGKNTTQCLRFGEVVVCSWCVEKQRYFYGNRIHHR